MDKQIASLLREAADMLGYIGCSPEGIDATVREAEDLMARIEMALNSMDDQTHE